jgi:tetratricopeptide (TPR) repeat protein
MSNSDKDNREQLEHEPQQRHGTLKSKLGLTIVISVLILVAGLLFYRNLKNKSKINELYQKVRQAEVLENYDEAIKRYQEILEINSLEEAAYFYMGNALSHQGKYDQAIENWKKSVQLNPNEALPYMGIGITLYAQGKYEEAIESYRRCLNIDPKFIDAKSNTAEAYLVTERFEKAFVMANEVLKEKDLLTSDKMGVSFIAIASLVFQEKDVEAGEALQRLTKYYRSVTREYERGWNYEDVKKFINQNKTLKENKRTLLLKLIDILESPKAEGDKKLKELETVERKIVCHWSLVISRA